ncbi:MAG: hypothetical protein QM768_21835 [Agriterribacter sp.]
MTDTELLELFDARVKRNPALITLMGKVKSVDENEMTCVIDDDGFEIPEVRLRPALDGKESFTIFPKPGSWCLAVRLEDSEEWMLIYAGEIDKYQIKQNDLVFEMDGQKFLIEKQGANLMEIIKNICEACLQIVVIQGNGQDLQKLTDALTKIQLLFK